MFGKKWRTLAAAVLAGTLVAAPALTSQAYAPTPNTMYSLPDNQPCLKGRFNCVVYPKAAQIPGGRIVASFELATVPASGTAIGETLPIYKSDDDGTTWQRLADLQAPAFMTSNPAYAKYTSAWTNPYLYTLPQAVGGLAAGTLLLSAVVSGEDEYYKEQKQANPNWVPDRDGDRRDMAIALYSSTNGGVSWTFHNIVAASTWSSGRSNANTYHQNDPIWEPFLLVYNNQLVAYYSDENEYTGYNASTGVPTPAANNATATDPNSQILVHRTWNGIAGSSWSSPVVDVAGLTFNSGGVNYIGGGRPGMTTVEPTTDGKWMLTYEYFGGGENVRYKISNSPLNFFSVGGAAGTEIRNLPVTAGSGTVTAGGSPVLTRLGDGRLAFNANGSADIWVNNGSSTGAWTQFHTTMPPAYSRNLTWDSRTGRVVILATQGSNVIFGEVDLGRSAGTYYKIVNRKTGQVIGTTNNITDANFGNGDVPDVRLEANGSAANPDTQLWHIVSKPGGGVALLNKAGGRSASVWTGSATAGQRIGQWVDDTVGGPFIMYTKANGDVYFQSASNGSLYLTGSTAGGGLTLQVSDAGAGAQDWQLIPQ